VLALAAQDGQGGSGFAYDADGLEVLGLGPGLTVLMGLPPPTPSAMAFRMSTSTTNFEPTIFTTTPFMALSLSEASWPLIFKAKKSGQNEIRWNFVRARPMRRIRSCTLALADRCPGQKFDLTQPD
jgi:hypothetical protein